MYIYVYPGYRVQRGGRERHDPAGDQQRRRGHIRERRPGRQHHLRSRGGREDHQRRGMEV